jgi:hypothetical protein
MSLADLYVADITAEEVEAGFVVAQVGHPGGLPVTVPAVVYCCADPSHRLIKTRGRDGIVFQLQAFGRPPSGARPVGWYAERYWPGGYGVGWVLDRLREHLGRPRYRALIDLHVPLIDDDPSVGSVPAAAGTALANTSPAPVVLPR